jgi:hypothetical protein
MSEVEMSHSLNAPISSIKWWLHIARRRLRQLLVGYDDQSTSKSAQSLWLVAKKRSHEMNDKQLNKLYFAN